MANTYTQLYTHIVFTVEGRQNVIPKKHKEELHKYITGIIKSKNQNLLTINSMPDHVHILIGMNPSIALSDLVRDIKSISSRFINENKWVIGRFNWQEGFGAFSYSRSHLDVAIKYIMNQESHHQKRTFREEYIELLGKYDVEYNPKYLFDWIEDESN